MSVISSWSVQEFISLDYLVAMWNLLPGEVAQLDKLFLGQLDKMTKNHAEMLDIV